MNLAFLLPEYPHPKVSAHCGGIGTSAKNLATGLVMNAHKLTIFVYGQDKDELFYDGLIEIHKIKHLRYPYFGWFLYRKHLQNYINEVIVAQKIQLLEAPDWTGITAFMKLKCPIVIRLHGSDAYFCKLEERKQKLKNFIFEKCALKKAKAIISVSNFTANKTKQIFKITKNIEIIYNGIDTDNFKDNINLKEILNGKEIGNDILYFGSIIRKKGVLELPDIFNRVIEKLPQTKLTFLGKDVLDNITGKPTLDLFKELLSKKALNNFIYIEQVPYNEVITYIYRASVVVLPSFAEAFPMTWLEAMAMSKALVTSNIGWAEEIIIDGVTGYSLHPKNHLDYANKIIELLQNKELRNKIGANARMHINNNFALKIIIYKNEQFYQKIINNDF